MTHFLALLHNPMRLLLAADVLALAVALVVLLWCGQYRRFPFLALWLAGHGARQVALLGWGVDFQSYSAIYNRTQDAAALLLLAMVAEAVWELRREAGKQVAKWRWAFFHSALFGLPLTLGWLSFSYKDIKPWDVQLLVMSISVWVAMFILLVIWEMRYYFEIDRRVFCHARLVAWFLLMGVLANWAGILRFWRAAGWLLGLATCGVGIGVAVIFRGRSAPQAGAPR